MFHHDSKTFLSQHQSYTTSKPCITTTTTSPPQFYRISKATPNTAPTTKTTTRNNHRHTHQPTAPTEAIPCSGKSMFQVRRPWRGFLTRRVLRSTRRARRLLLKCIAFLYYNFYSTYFVVAYLSIDVFVVYVSIIELPFLSLSLMLLL